MKKAKRILSLITSLCMTSACFMSANASVSNESAVVSETTVPVTSEVQSKEDLEICMVVSVGEDEVLLNNDMAIYQKTFQEYSGESFNLKYGDVIGLANIHYLETAPMQPGLTENSYIKYFGSAEDYYAESMKNLTVTEISDDFEEITLIDLDGQSYTWYTRIELMDLYGRQYDIDPRSVNIGDVLNCITEPMENLFGEGGVFPISTVTEPVVTTTEKTANSSAVTLVSYIGAGDADTSIICVLTTTTQTTVSPVVSSTNDILCGDGEGIVTSQYLPLATSIIDTDEITIVTSEYLPLATSIMETDAPETTTVTSISSVTSAVQTECSFGTGVVPNEMITDLDVIESMIAEFIEESDLGAEVHVDSEIEPNAVLVTVWDWTKQDETTEPIKTFMQENNILGSLVEFLILEGAEETVLGDANGDNELTVRDCAFIASALAKGFVGQLDSSADFNGDGNVNVRDAAAISRSLAGAK